MTPRKKQPRWAGAYANGGVPMVDEWDDRTQGAWGAFQQAARGAAGRDRMQGQYRRGSEYHELVLERWEGQVGKAVGKAVGKTVGKA